MHSGHMLRECTWPDHVRLNMRLANVHVTQIVYGKSWWEELSKELTDTYHDFPRSPLRGVSKMLDSILAWLQPVP
jgi:hypothetical protein